MLTYSLSASPSTTRPRPSSNTATLRRKTSPSPTTSSPTGQRLRRKLFSATNVATIGELLITSTSQPMPTLSTGLLLAPSLQSRTKEGVVLAGPSPPRALSKVLTRFLLVPCSASLRSSSSLVTPSSTRVATVALRMRPTSTTRVALMPSLSLSTPIDLASRRPYLALTTPLPPLPSLSAITPTCSHRMSAR